MTAGDEREGEKTQVTTPAREQVTTGKRVGIRDIIESRVRYS